MKASFELRVANAEKRRAVLAAQVGRLLGSEYDAGVARREDARDVNEELARTAAVRERLYRAALAKEVARQAATEQARAELMAVQREKEEAPPHGDDRRGTGSSEGGGAAAAAVLSSVVTLEDLQQAERTKKERAAARPESNEEQEDGTATAAAVELAPWQKRQGHTLVGQAQGWRRSLALKQQAAKPRPRVAAGGGTVRRLRGSAGARNHAASVAALQRPQDEARAQLLREAAKASLPRAMKATRSVSVMEVLPLGGGGTSTST